MELRGLFSALVALLTLGLGLLLLEQPRTGLAISGMDVDGTPATIMQVPGVEAPVVVIAHGFSGSRPLMHTVQLTLARAGYIAVSFDFEGHGENQQPMLLNLSSPENLRLRQMAELSRVIDTALDLPGADGRLALVGHSMASDVVVRSALDDGRVGAVVAISLVSDAVTTDAPSHLLILNGQFEPRLRAHARDVMAAIGGLEGETLGVPSGEFARRAVAVPFTEHVGVLYSPTTASETLNWLNARFDREAADRSVRLGPAILLTMLGLVLIARPFAQTLPRGRRLGEVPPGAFWTLAFAPGLLAALVLRLAPTDFLPVILADYLAVHLAVYGILMLFGLAVVGDAPVMRGWRAGLSVAFFGIVVVGAVLDRYVVNFIPSETRWPIVAALLPGAILAMLGEATLIEAGRAPIWRRVIARTGFFVSLGVAVLLDPARLGFLAFIAPVFLLFYLMFGSIAGSVGRRSGSAMAMGLGLGIILAWSLAVSFPMAEFQ